MRGENEEPPRHQGHRKICLSNDGGLGVLGALAAKDELLDKGEEGEYPF